MQAIHRSLIVPSFLIRTIQPPKKGHYAAYLYEALMMNKKITAEDLRQIFVDELVEALVAQEPARPYAERQWPEESEAWWAEQERHYWAHIRARTAAASPVTPNPTCPSAPTWDIAHAVQQRLQALGDYLDGLGADRLAFADTFRRLTTEASAGAPWPRDVPAKPDGVYWLPRALEDFQEDGIIKLVLQYVGPGKAPAHPPQVVFSQNNHVLEAGFQQYEPSSQCLTLEYEEALLGGDFRLELKQSVPDQIEVRLHAAQGEARRGDSDDL